METPKWWTSQHGVIYRNRQTEEWQKASISCCLTSANPPCFPCTGKGYRPEEDSVSSSYATRLLENSCPNMGCFPGHPMYLSPPFCPNPLRMLYCQHLKTCVFSGALPMLKKTSMILVKPPTPSTDLSALPFPKGLLLWPVLRDQICIYESQNVSAQGSQW